jgi:flagellar biosynthesis/type III secretory pathway protein FliH
MNKIIIIACCLLVIFTANIALGYNQDYGKGYQRGYQKGYQFQEKGGIEPIAPIAPIPPIPNIGEKGYDDGYRRGVIEGHNKRQEQQQQQGGW